MRILYRFIVCMDKCEYDMHVSMLGHGPNSIP